MRPSLASTQRVRASSLKQRSKPCPARLIVNERNDFALVRRKLETYGDLPLHVRIRLPIQDKSYMTALLRQHVSKFISLDIHVPEHEDAEEIVSSIGEGQPAPLLERLSISVKQRPRHRIPSFAALKNAFYPSPRLTHLSLPPYPLPDITIPHLTTVTSLTIDSVQAQAEFYLFHLFDILESMPHLQHFAFKSFDNFSFSYLSDINFSRVLSMPNLVSAEISAPGCGLEILHALDAPLLTSVRFDGYHPFEYQESYPEATNSIGPILTSLLRGSERSPKIKCLELRSTVMNDADYSKLLCDKTFPQLEVLRLDAANISDETLCHETAPMRRSKTLEMLLNGENVRLDTANISDETLRMGTAHMRNLKRLELLNCENLSGAAVKRFVYWQVLDKNFVVLIDACPSITQEDIMSLSKIVVVESKATSEPVNKLL